jgi:hypothetical protein
MDDEKTVDFAMQGIQREIKNEVKDMSMEELHLLHSMYKKFDFRSCERVNDFVTFVSTFARFFDKEQMDKLYDYTEKTIKEALAVKCQQELFKAISEALHEVTHKSLQEELRRKELKEFMDR